MTNCFKLGQIEPNSRRCVVVGNCELCFAHPYRGMKGIQLQMIPIKANSFLNPVKDNRKIDIQTVRVRITQSRITCRNHQRFFSFGLGFVSDLWLLGEGNGWGDGDCRGGMEFSQWSYSVGKVKVKFSSCQAQKENYICFIFRLFQNTHTHTRILYFI